MLIIASETFAPSSEWVDAWEVLAGSGAGAGATSGSGAGAGAGAGASTGTGADTATQGAGDDRSKEEEGEEEERFYRAKVDIRDFDMRGVPMVSGRMAVGVYLYVR